MFRVLALVFVALLGTCKCNEKDDDNKSREQLQAQNSEYRSNGRTGIPPDPNIPSIGAITETEFTIGAIKTGRVATVCGYLNISLSLFT